MLERKILSGFFFISQQIELFFIEPWKKKLENPASTVGNSLNSYSRGRQIESLSGFVSAIVY